MTFKLKSASAFTSKSSTSVSATGKLEWLSQLEATKVEANHIMAVLQVTWLDQAGGQ